MPILSLGWGMRRREFFSVIGGAAAWPLVAQAQQGGQPRRIGILLNAAVDDPKFKTWVMAFLQSLQQFGWTDGRNVQIDTRWSGGNKECDSKSKSWTFHVPTRRSIA